jgi:Inner membrane protein YgaP-like, transmembrane domain
MSGKSFFRRNVGMLDRMFRFCGSIFLIILGSFFLEGIIGIVVLVWGVFMLLTAFTAFCPAYFPFGISTTGSLGGSRAGMSSMMSRCCSEKGELPGRRGSLPQESEAGDESRTEARNA